MATQQGPPPRPWFRLATMVRPPPPPQPDQAPPPPPPPPRPAFIRPAFSQPFRAPPPANGVPPPSPPTPPPQPASNTPLQPSRPPSAVATSLPPPSRSVSPTMNRAISSPPKNVKPLEKNSPPSPTNTMKPISHPPSPLALPSPQLNSYNPEYEQKTVLVQETKEKPKALDNRRHMPKSDAPKKPETSKKHSDSEDGGMRIITIAGENKGAVMDLNPFGKKTHNFGNNPHSLHIKKENPTGSSDGEKSESKNKNHKSNSPLMSAVMNCNVQGVNNSILYNCSTTHHDPGVHLSLSRKPSGGRGL